MIIIEKTIQDTKVTLEVDEKLPNNKLGGTPILHIGKELAVIYAVDTLTLIKGIHNSETLQELADYTKGTWAENQVTEIVGGIN